MPKNIYNVFKRIVDPSIKWNKILIQARNAIKY